MGHSNELCSSGPNSKYLSPLQTYSPYRVVFVTLNEGEGVFPAKRREKEIEERM
jgi:hypothetical protein